MDVMVIVSLPLILLLLVAVGYDTKYRRIPNWLVLLGLVYGFCIAFFSISSITMADALLGMFIGGAIFIYPYSKGYVGAGDVKLAGVVGLFLGPQQAIMAALFSMIIGAVFALIYAKNKKILKHVLTNLMVGRTDGVKLPYAAAISGGSLLAIFLARSH